MNLKKIFLATWFQCAVLIAIMFAAVLFEACPLRLVENFVYDRLSALRHRDSDRPVAYVAIDRKSVGHLGPWPWDRNIHADLIQKLAEGGAKNIGFNLPLVGREHNRGLEELREIQNEISREATQLGKKSVTVITRKLQSARKRLDSDMLLQNAIKKAGNVTLALLVELGEQPSDNGEVPGWLQKEALESIREATVSQNPLAKLTNPFSHLLSDFVHVTDIDAPYVRLADSAAGLGHNGFVPAHDNVVRSDSLFLPYTGYLFPSMALRLAMAHQGEDLSGLRAVYGMYGPVRIDSLSLAIPATRNYQMYIDFNGGDLPYERFSYIDVVNGKIEPAVFKGKTVVVGVSLPWQTEMYTAPGGERMSSAEVSAVAVENILSGNHIARPSWAWLVELIVLLYFGIFLMFIIPRVSMRVGALILVIFMTSWLAGSALAFSAFGLWLQPAAAVILAVAGFILVGINRKFIAGRQPDHAVEANKMMGLSFQSQGLLDMALEKFMKCPVRDVSVKDLLYNLALDFERKRMHNKAVAVYEHILSAGDFKDVGKRVERAGQSSKFSSPIGTNDITMPLGEPGAAPTIGRYEILEELGQGAIGTVYLGRDPKINREVAVKTVRYEEVEAEYIEEVRERFFREAEAAGKLSHPCIVTIYDVGEDHDMTYMAMELLSGGDLTLYCKKENLLPLEKVLEVIIEVAGALEYAHKHNVVHRDIKPANIVLLENGHVKVADFGIARIMTSSHTKTGVVMGTPNYMSPEQVAGKKVDGRSDLFSLGVVFYELLTGTKPFQHENVATLMHSIATVSYEPVTELRDDVPDCCVEVLEKLMVKAKSRRYQTAEKILEDIRNCLGNIRG